MLPGLVMADSCVKNGKCGKDVCLCRASMAGQIGTFGALALKHPDLPDELSRFFALVAAAVASGNEKAILSSVSEDVAKWVAQQGSEVMRKAKDVMSEEMLAEAFSHLSDRPKSSSEVN